MNLPARLQALVGLSLALTVLPSQGQPELIIKPQGESQTRALGDSILFTCTVTGLGSTVDPDLKWFDKEGLEIYEVSGRVYIEQDGNDELKLYITNIQNSDAGTYSCRATIEGNRQEKPVSLLLFQDITFDHAPSPQFPRIYTDALIQCRVSGQPKPTVSYRYMGKKIENGGRYVYENDGLRILNITEEDNGDYICRAEVANDGRLKEAEITVIVHIPPKITEGPGTVEGVERNEVTISCSATGKPDPQFDWFKDNSEAPISGNDRIIVDSVAGAVHFRPVYKEDEGDYKCKASNDVGFEEATGRLSVIVPPVIVDYANRTGLEGSSGKLLCVANGDPEPTMSFRKVGNSEDYIDGENEGGRIIVRKIGAGQHEITIDNLHPDDTSNYTCFANNKGGFDRQNGTMHVQFPPRFDNDHPTFVYNWLNMKRNITCHALGEPEPYIDWFRGTEKLTENNETFRIIRMGRTSVLQVTVHEYEQGWIYQMYTCSATNELDTGTIDIEMRRAHVPDAPLAVNEKEKSPTSVLFTIVPPENDGGMPIYGYRVEYDGTMQDFRVGEDILIENLLPMTRYILHFRAKNDVGVGDTLQHSFTTDPVRKPYPIKIKSDHYGKYPYRYNILWEKPRNGGLPIREYQFKYRRVTVQGDTWEPDKPLSDYIIRHAADDPDAPKMSYELNSLKPSMYYQLEVTAKNDMGWSFTHDTFVFLTEKDLTLLTQSPAPDFDDLQENLEDESSSQYGGGEETDMNSTPMTPTSNGASSNASTGMGDMKPMRQRTGLGTGAIIGIVIAVFFIFLIIVDISCYFMNDCGVLMCVCVHLCGKQQSLMKEKAMEEGESKAIIREQVEETKAPPPLESVHDPVPQEGVPNRCVEDDDDLKKPLETVHESDRLKDEPEDDLNKEALKDEIRLEEGTTDEKAPLTPTDETKDFPEVAQEVHEEEALKPTQVDIEIKDKTASLEDAEPQAVA